MTRRNRILVALFVGGIVWLAYWFLYGRDLTYDVFSGDTYWHTEDFSLRGRLIITSFIALVTTFLVWLGLVFFKR